MEVLKVSAEEWRNRFSELAHKAVFALIKPAHFDRIDYALLVLHEDKPCAYVTVRELDHETVYWQFGGGFPWAQKSILMATSYDAMLNKQKELGSKRMTTRIENTNLPMLRLAISRKLQIIGCRVWGGETLVEFVKEWSDGNDEKLREHDKPKASASTSKT